MRIRLPLLVLCFYVGAAARANDIDSGGPAMEACKRSMSKEFEVVKFESIADGDMSYREFEGLRFGLIGKLHAFIQYAEDAPVRLEDIQIHDIERRDVKFKSEALAIERSELYLRNEKKQKIFCLVTPFSGLGSSGSFQQYAVLMALSVQQAKISEPIGEVIWRRRSAAPGSVIR